MKMVSLVRTSPHGVSDKTTLVLEPDGSIRVMGVLPHGWTFKPATAEDTKTFVNHLLPEKADGQCG